ncbi:hypothetical protein [Jeotgalibacillus terrae]|uniref:SseB protein N-terminal domain-containing protein n=1 Tax=Jeotgalibacillus terrae TaxID=587735 RepID=A0ABW5ZJB4_9BACL|nr:hypothetical protein [Jeotgalibacillus terrae]MBM7580832.1 hypothetical protein [Jeotgalibacillus terrae]
MNLAKQLSTEKELIFKQLPNLLIQDSKTLNRYYIQSEELRTHLVKNKKENMDNTMTFLIPDGNFVDEVEFVQITENPSVLIKFPKGNEQYYLTSDQLKEYEVKSIEEMMEMNDNYLTFIIPTGDEFLEDIPNMAPAMLQSGTPRTEFGKPIDR